MEKFINNLYSNSNFPIILVCLIAIFVVLFIITLILALKDAKNNSLDEDEKKEEPKDKVEFKDPVPEVKEEPQTFEEVSFDSEEAKEEKADKYSGVSFEEPKVNDAAKETSPIDVIEETTTSIPVLKDEEISNFEEFFLQNLKEKSQNNNVFDFSKKEDKEEVSPSEEDRKDSKEVSENNDSKTSSPVTLESAFPVNDDNENNLESGSDNEDDVISFDEKEVFENKEEAPVSMELPKMKKEYTFKELDGESYRIR